MELYQEYQKANIMHCNQGAELVRHYNNIVLFWEETDLKKKKFLSFSKLVKEK